MSNLVVRPRTQKVLYNENLKSGSEMQELKSGI